jgi:hypothetical protein
MPAGAAVLLSATMQISNTFLKTITFSVILLHLGAIDVSGQHRRWNLADNGGIRWQVDQSPIPHTDQIEMSGRQVSLILTYGVDSLGQLVIHKKEVFPMLRVFPNNTHGSLIKEFEQPAQAVLLNGAPIQEKPISFFYDGIIRMNTSAGPVNFTRSIFPSADKAAVIEDCTIKNNGKESIIITIPDWIRNDTTEKAKSVYGPYILSNRVEGAGRFTLLSGQQCSYSVITSARKLSDEPYTFSPGYETTKRRVLVAVINNNLQLRSPNDTLNQMFAFAKLRATESIFDTKNGLMHAPGGGSYYAAIWANDQAEYVNPFFPFLGNDAGNESALNSFRLFAGYINLEYKPLPSSIIAEGTDIWAGAGDRGDQAMIAYGASRFALAYGDSVAARKLWPLINWCLNYLQKKKTADGVIASDADELEGRFPAGKVNLSTNVLAYGALVSASHLAAELGEKSTSEKLMQQSQQLRKDIEKYFGANVQGFDTYRYYDGNTKLRSWIGLPLVMGIFERKKQTLKALYSSHLWTKDGMLSESGSNTYWDRSLLYAMRGSFYAGATDSTLKYLNYYSANRLLGEHVPYAIEAWPEGNQRHLSAESGLYCRLITEGLFGIEPTGFKTFTIKPTLPSGWKEMSLDHVRAFNANFNIRVVRSGKIEQVFIKQANGKTKVYRFAGTKPVEIKL